jgi:hypothetical protein
LKPKDYIPNDYILYIGYKYMDRALVKNTELTIPNSSIQVFLTFIFLKTFSNSIHSRVIVLERRVIILWALFVYHSQKEELLLWEKS